MSQYIARRTFAAGLLSLGLAGAGLAWAQGARPMVAEPPPPAAGKSLPKPAGSAILTVNGNIAMRNTAEAAVFDASMIRSLPAQTLHTHTPWYKEAVTFKGTPLQDLLDAVGARGQSLRIIALNDYAVEIPIEDARRFRPLLAYEINGKRLSVRDKGPLFLIYPFDERPELRNELYYGRSIWQISTITVR